MRPIAYGYAMLYDYEDRELIVMNTNKETASCARPAVPRGPAGAGPGVEENHVVETHTGRVVNDRVSLNITRRGAGGILPHRWLPAGQSLSPITKYGENKKSKGLSSDDHRTGAIHLGPPLRWPLRWPALRQPNL